MKCKDLEGRVLIILAGGSSKRMGEPKGLLKITDEKSLLQMSLERFAQAGGDKTIIVFGNHASQYHAEQKNWNLSDLQIQTFVNPNPELGPFSSLKVAVEKLKPGESAFVLPVDVPAPSVNAWHWIGAALTSDIEVVLPFNGKSGHPVLLSAAFCKKIKARQVDENARLDFMIQALPESAKMKVWVDEPSINWNLNTPEDFKNFRESINP